jgi:outer membrane PBP1 activator LpoA protein
MIVRLLHRPNAAFVLLAALLYGVAFGLAIDAARAADPALPAPHVALILPLNSPSFARHADAVRLGFLAAMKAQPADAPLVRVYAVNEDTQDLLTIYERAVESGARLVVGPLTRSGVSALAASSLVTVPTLALNSLEPRATQPPRLYLFGLALEFEARQVARAAFEDGRRNAFVISDETPLSKRMRQAFVEEFAAAGGTVVAEFSYGADAVSLNKLRLAAGLGVADAFFVALDFARARTVRPYLGNSIALYATSQVNANRTSALAAHDLNLVRFLDMPWLLQPDHPAVMVYPRAQYGDAVDFDRLYALGIDAFRVGLELLRQNREPQLDGVTGRIRLAPGQQFLRDLTEAQFVDGKITILREARP